MMRLVTLKFSLNSEIFQKWVGFVTKKSIISSTYYLYLKVKVNRDGGGGGGGGRKKFTK